MRDVRLRRAALPRAAFRRYGEVELNSFRNESLSNLDLLPTTALRKYGDVRPNSFRNESLSNLDL